MDLHASDFSKNTLRYVLHSSTFFQSVYPIFEAMLLQNRLYHVIRILAKKVIFFQPYIKHMRLNNQRKGALQHMLQRVVAFIQVAPK